VIAAERRGDTVEKPIEQVISVTGDQDAALSSVGLTELAHGVYRAQTPAMRLRRQSFILKTAVEPLPVLDLLESTNTYSCWGFHPFGVMRGSC
jgi:hypothetical protein